ncbi:acid protease [Hanseniaspora valbyensis NRRL Y-1626]|uniref:Acid protease n=1 Tax=Hanseniaspora valbyensis NRRL Y-1626 TaxID=766949 RepID=A0A1B7TIE4_9ASCO|nr:acid protease [Hanseniaspora valbyensis NRRL Y-1626]
MLYNLIFSLLLSTVTITSLSEANSLALPFTKKEFPNSAEKRDVPDSLINEGSFYYVTLQVGSDLQENELLIDTGSSDTFVLTSSFDSSSSTTFYNNGTEFLVQYGSGTVTGTWGQDSVSLDDTTIGRLSFGVASSSSSGKGLLGLGLSGLETTYSGALGIDYQYSNFPILLRENGLISATIFQIYLNEKSSSSGTILFGAVDTGKASNSVFYELPIVNIYESIGYTEPVEYMVTVQGMGTVVSSTESTITTTKQVALFDTGATLTMVSSYILESIVSNLGAASNSNGYYSVSCDSDATIVLDFGGFQIDVPIKQTFIGTNGDQCYIGLTTTTSEYMIFGDSFLRAMTVVFDLDNYVIGLAQAEYDASSSVVESTGGIPSGVKASGYDDIYESYVSPVSGGDIFTITTASTSATSTSETTSTSTRETTSTSTSETTSFSTSETTSTSSAKTSTTSSETSTTTTLSSESTSTSTSELISSSSTETSTSSSETTSSSSSTTSPSSTSSSETTSSSSSTTSPSSTSSRKTTSSISSSSSSSSANRSSSTKADNTISTTVLYAIASTSSSHNSTTSVTSTETTSSIETTTTANASTSVNVTYTTGTTNSTSSTFSTASKNGAEKLITSTSFLMVLVSLFV